MKNDTLPLIVGPKIRRTGRTRPSQSGWGRRGTHGRILRKTRLAKKKTYDKECLIYSKAAAAFPTLSRWLTPKGKPEGGLFVPTKNNTADVKICRPPRFSTVFFPYVWAFPASWFSSRISHPFEGKPSFEEKKNVCIINVSLIFLHVWKHFFPPRTHTHTLGNISKIRPRTLSHTPSQDLDRMPGLLSESIWSVLVAVKILPIEKYRLTKGKEVGNVRHEPSGKRKKNKIGVEGTPELGRLLFFNFFPLPLSCLVIEIPSLRGLVLSCCRHTHTEKEKSYIFHYLELFSNYFTP